MILRSQILGQTKLLDRLDSYNLDTFPHSVILVGDEGCGKHTVSTYIAENILKMSLFDISDNLSHEIIEEIYTKTNPSVYLIDISTISEKDQNSILKFIEEPLPHIFTILLTNSKNILLPTVINRCVSFEFDPYKADILKSFIPSNQDIDDIILENVLKTPGKVKISDTSKLKEIHDLCQKMLDKLSIATYSNSLSIAQKINYKDNYDKYDFQIFLNMLLFHAYQKVLNTLDIKDYNKYLTLVDLYKQLQDSRLNKEIFIEKLISNLWRLSR